MTQEQFQPMQKISRLFRDVIVTEKIDGTNASIRIGEDGEFQVASRTRWITPEDDNHGFAKWAYEYRVRLMELGPGHHFGEWWGKGIQRGYGLQEKRFSLFNATRWTDKIPEALKGIVHTVPILHTGTFNTFVIEGVKDKLRYDGSAAAPGFMQPEGIVVFHVAGYHMFKSTLEKDEKHKGEA